MQFLGILSEQLNMKQGLLMHMRFVFFKPPLLSPNSSFIVFFTNLPHFITKPLYNAKTCLNNWHCVSSFYCKYSGNRNYSEIFISKLHAPVLKTNISSSQSRLFSETKIL